jgi:hypothetical protein
MWLVALSTLRRIKRLVVQTMGAKLVAAKVILKHCQVNTTGQRLKRSIEVISVL